MPNPSKNGEHELDLETLRADMSKLKTDISTIVGSITESNNEKLTAVRAKAKDLSKRAVRATESQIQERPFLSIFLVFVVGLVLGKWIDARMRT